MLYLVRLSVPRRGSRREWETIRDEFEDALALAGQQSPAVTGLRIDSEFRRGRDYVRAVIVATADAGSVADALELVWHAFGEASCTDTGGWDLAAASAEVAPGAPLDRAGRRDDVSDHFGHDADSTAWLLFRIQMHGRQAPRTRRPRCWTAIRPPPPSTTRQRRPARARSMTMGSTVSRPLLSDRGVIYRHGGLPTPR